MKERSSTHQEASSSPSHVFRKPKTSEGSSATASGLNASFTHVPASGAIQRSAVEEGSGAGGGILLTDSALAVLPPDVLASLNGALGGAAGTTSEAYDRGRRDNSHVRQVFSKDVENPRHVVDRSESDKTGFDTKGNTMDSKGTGAEGAGSLRLQSPTGESGRLDGTER